MAMARYKLQKVRKSCSIKCDECKKELVVDSCYPHKYSLMLSCIDTGINSSDTVYAVVVRPPIDGVRYFCGKACLVNWLHSKYDTGKD